MKRTFGMLLGTLAVSALAWTGHRVVAQSSRRDTERRMALVCR